MDTLQQLSPFLSRLELEAPRDAAPATWSVDGAVLFTDFAGFTPLTERLSAQGPAGAEQLSEILNWYYSILTDGIAELGGDVVLFAGDALLAVFDGERSAASRAVRAALDIQQRLSGARPPHGASLGLRAAVGGGTLTAHRVGGTDGRWITLLGGAPLDDVFNANAATKPGSVSVTRSTWATIANDVRGEWVAGSEYAIVHEWTGALDGQDNDAAKIPIHDADGKAAELLVLPVLRDRIASGQGEFLAEFRETSMAFVRLDGVDPGTPAALQRLHCAALIVEEETNRREGAVYQMLRDDKGCSAVLAFGLPGQSHDDDAARASDAAAAITGRLRDAGIGASAGVATGSVFCGTYGGETRRNYGILGPTINRAARLMGVAESRVIIDETTNTRAARWLESRALPQVKVKGVTAPLRVFEPIGRRSAQTDVADAPMIGRAEEAARIQARIAKLADGVGGSIVIDADAGMGKSTLLRRAVELSRDAKLAVLEGSADSIEQGTAYLALRPVIRRLLEIPAVADAETMRGAALARLERISHRTAELAPLLNTVLPFDFPENALTEQMSGTIRAANLTDLLVALVGAVASERPLVIALEDLHWMDDASIQLASRIVDSSFPALVVATTRPMSPEPAAVTRLADGERAERIALTTLDASQIVELVRRRLGARTIPVAVKDLILAKAEGNPFYSEELAIALRETGVIEVRDGECRVADGDALSSLNLPGTVKGVITSRVDRLPGDTQLTLKVASVLGRTFDASVLETIHPARASATAIDQSLADLERAELVVREAAGTRQFAFRHALIQETTYTLLPFAQRRPLHAAAAEHLESAHAEELSPYYARLAYHWSRAERPEKAVRYLGEAGRQALESYANQSAVDFFSEAIKLDEGLRGPLSVDARRASWHRQLAEGSYSLIQWEHARVHYEQAIRLSGFPAPRFGFATPIEVVKHVRNRYAKRGVSADSVQLTESQREQCIEALRACDNLQVVYLWQGNRLSLAHTVFEGANIAARVGPCAESAFARAMLGYLLAVAGMRETAERDLRSAVEMAEQSGQLLQRVSCNMYLGMTLSLFGRPHEGMPYLKTADDLVSRLGAGLWKHRGKYMLAEPHLMLADFSGAADLFADCATISMSVEPPITGFANAMRALCWIRQGNVDDALALIHGPTGVRLVRDNPIGLQLYNTLGALIEGYMWTGQWSDAFAAAREGVAIPERGDDANAFFTGYNGHAAIARVLLTMIERRRNGAATEGPSEDELWSLARRALKNFRKATKMFPGAQAPYFLVEGLFHDLAGKTAAARAAWSKCIDAATRAPMPYEKAMAEFEIARRETADRATRLREVSATFASLGMPRYAARAIDVAEGRATGLHA